MPGAPRDSILPHPAVYAVTAGAAAVAWSLAAGLWFSGNRALAVSLLLVGLSLGPCLMGYATAPRPLKQQQRRLGLVTAGLSILAPLLRVTALADVCSGCGACTLACPMEVG